MLGPNDTNFGHAIALGDINDDGCGDILIGAPVAVDQRQQAPSNVYLFHGPITNDSIEQATKLQGEGHEDRTGWSVSLSGDLNNDGKDDLVIGADRHSASGLIAGAVYIVNGPVDEDMNLADADAKLLGVQPGDHAGWAVSHSGDVNEDGFDDLLVGAPFAEREAGVVYLLHGPIEGTQSLSEADVIFTGFPRGARAGHSLSIVGDFNQDGFDDIAIGAYLDSTAGREAGAVYLFYGPVSGQLEAAQANVILTGETDGDWFGHSVAGAGDVNGDGFADIAIGAHLFDGLGSQTGAVYLLPGLGQ